MNADPFQEWCQRLPATGVVFALPPEAEIIASGPDACRFLNGQLSANITKLEPGWRIPACLLSPKGKLLALVWCSVVGRGSERLYSLRVPASLAEDALARLDRYLVADAVELELRSAEPLWHWLPGQEVPSLPGTLRAVRRLRPGLDLSASTLASIPPERAPVPLMPETSEWLRVATGQPAHPEELQDQPFPAEVGLDRSAVDFHKGCYLGQEIVSRLESVGHPRHLLCRILPQEPLGISACQPGAELLAGEQIAGTITSWATAPELPPIGLANLKAAYANPDTELHLPSSARPFSALTVLPLLPTSDFGLP